MLIWVNLLVFKHIRCANGVCRKTFLARVSNRDVYRDIDLFVGTEGMNRRFLHRFWDCMAVHASNGGCDWQHPRPDRT